MSEETPVVSNPYLQYDDFAKLDLRIGVVVEATEVPKADKLLHLKVDVGEATPRTVVAGIKQHYIPDTMIGKKIMVLCNLEPRQLRGITSTAMLLAASDNEGHLSLLIPDKEIIAGSKIK